MTVLVSVTDAIASMERVVGEGDSSVFCLLLGYRGALLGLCIYIGTTVPYGLNPTDN